MVNDTSPQLGGDLQTNGNDIHFGDSSSTTDDNLYFGADNDLRIYHASDVNYIAGANSSNIYIQGDDVAILNQAGNQTGLCNGGGSLDLFIKFQKFETKSYGTHVTGYQSSSSYVGFHVKGTLNDHGFGTNTVLVLQLMMLIIIRYTYVW